jgi:hypothetical protein
MTTTQLTPEEKLERRRAQKREAARKWRAAHPEKRAEKAEYARKYYQENRESILEEKREYYQENREERRQYKKQRYSENREVLIQYQREYYALNKESVKKSVRSYHFKSNYNLTMEEREALLQTGCQICGTHEGRLVVDHDHDPNAKNAYRGCLCNRCNIGLGDFKDSIENLLNGAEYLERFNQTPHIKSEKKLYARNDYGLTPAEKAALLAGGCQICGTKDGKLHIDLCPTKTQVRGCLCNSCSGGLGMFKNSPDNLLNAVKYLHLHIN